MLGFTAKVVALGAGVYVLNKVFDKTKVLEKLGERAMVAGFAAADGLLTKAAESIAARNKGGAQ